jgi:hypothetical protein
MSGSLEISNGGVCLISGSPSVDNDVVKRRQELLPQPPLPRPQPGVNVAELLSLVIDVPA